jgi:hypothetical protein
VTESPSRSMRSRFYKPRNRVLNNSRFSRANIAVFAVIFAAVGGYIIYSSFAAGFSASNEPENSAVSLPATLFNDANASGGKAVQFGNGALQTKNCMPAPAACGYPDIGTVGVQSGITLTPVSGSLNLSTAGQVYQNKVVTGDMVVTAPNVTIRNVKLVITNPDYGIKSFGGSGVSNLTLDHVEIDLNHNYNGKGIAFDDYTAKNVWFHNGADCAHVSGNVTIQDSLCTDGPDDNDDGWPDNTAFCSIPGLHIDGFQSDGGSNITLRHNTVRNPCDETSDILMSSNTAHISHATIDNNLLAGGGYSLYCAAGDPSSVDNIVATNNRIAKSFYPTGGHFGPTAYCENATIYSGNVWDDTGASL